MSVVERERVREAYARREQLDRYDPSRPDQVALSRVRSEVWARELARRAHFLGTVLEVGCGTGGVVHWAADAGAESVVGVDVIDERLREADAAYGMGHYVLADGSGLPIADGTVDTVVCSTLFSSILDDAVATTVVTELDRVLRPDGALLWFDFFRDNPRNRDVRGVRLSQLRSWFGGYEMHVERVVLAPPIARRLRARPGLAAALERIRPLRTHLAGALWKPAADAQGRG